MSKPVSAIITPRIRCAIYTRKSTEEGLEQEFNSLDAQREAGEAFITSQRHEGWITMSQRYDDPGYSGGSLERPALERLLKNVENHKVDCVVVYKVDRLSRSLLDFAKIIETFERNGVSFVSVTQRIDTSTSMGRLLLNVLLSFAQFEREIIGERIRDKVAAAKRRGKFTGGTPPLGYDVDAEKTRLIVNPEEARLVQHIFKRFVETGSPLTIADELNKKGVTTKAWMTKKGVFREGKSWHKRHLQRVLCNRTYLGEVIHKDKTYPGEHQAIITKDLWDRAHAVRENNTRHRTQLIRDKSPALLKGIIRCGTCDKAMSPVATGSAGKTYRYYTCGRASKAGHSSCPVKSVPAGDIETAVIEQLRVIFRSPEMVAQTYCGTQKLEVEQLESLRTERAEMEARLAELMQSTSSNEAAADVIDSQRRLQDINDDVQQIQLRLVSERDVAECLRRLDPIWDELFPVEQSRIVQLLVERVTVNADGMNIKIRSHGLHLLVNEIRDTTNRHQRSRAT
ncbi:MAG: recombinase family protein [Armatimonadota bacterium]